jgi:Na+-driven multidrug efflux pump
VAVRLFTSDEQLIDFAVTGMRLSFMMFPLVGFQMVATNFFQSLGMASKAIFLSLTRQLLFLLPGLLFLPRLFINHTSWEGSWGVWCAIPLSDLLSAIVTAILLAHQLRRFKQQHLQPTA